MSTTWTDKVRQVQASIVSWLRASEPAVVPASPPGHGTADQPARTTALGRTVRHDFQTFLVALLILWFAGEAFEWFRPWGLTLAVVPVLGLFVAGWIAYTRSTFWGRTRTRSGQLSVAIVFAAMVIYARWSAWWGVPVPLVRPLERGNLTGRAASAAPLKSINVQPELQQQPGSPPDQRALIVLVHGFGGPLTEGYRQLVKEIHGCRPGDDLLRLTFPTRLFSNADPALIADEINAQIDEQFHSNRGGEGYREVILVGHSIGALLVRKAYLYGRGRTDDAPGWPANVPARPWAKKVGRIVLLAGVNRGWKSDSDTIIAGGWWRQLAHLGDTFAWMTGTAGLVRGFEAGSPFVANLRVQWIGLWREKPGEVTKPTVVQLLGVEDELVGVGDSRDVAVNSDFIFVPVRGSNHTSILRFDDSAYGAGRRAAFRRAMAVDKTAIDRLRDEYAGEKYKTDCDVRKVVFVLHGIRDMGHWTDWFEKAFASQAEGVKVLRPRYGYFPMGPFLLFEDRQKYVRWFMDEYTEALARYPGAAADINFIGHSNGCYVLASALAQYRTLRINRAMFAGSVVPRAYDWADRLNREQVRSVRNDLGSADWVVGIFPRMVELFHDTFSTLIGPSDIGSAGFNGFTAVGGQMQENYFLHGQHGAALQRENVRSIVDYVMEREPPTPAAPIAQTQSPLVLNLSQLCWLVWFGIALVVVLLYPVFCLAVFLLNRLFALLGLPLSTPPWARLPLYVLLLLAFLYSY